MVAYEVIMTAYGININVHKRILRYMRVSETRWRYIICLFVVFHPRYCGTTNTANRKMITLQASVMLMQGCAIAGPENDTLQASDMLMQAFPNGYSVH